jgi:glycerol uptake facilitator protein
VGAALGAFSYRKLIGRHLPCDTCVEEEKKSSSTTQHNASL